MSKPLTPEELELLKRLEVEREELYENARVKRKQMIDAFKKYNKLANAHDHFVNEHNKIDRKIFLLTPGITILKAQKRKERAKAKAEKREPAKMTIADVLGSSDIESKLKKMIADKQRKSKLEKNNLSDEK